MSFTDYHLYFDDVAVGQQWQSAGRTITETDIVNYAGLSGDFNSIHVDHEFAKQTPYRKPIAHGLLVFAIASGLSIAFPLMRTLAFIRIEDWQFTEPVFPGDTVSVRTTVVAKEIRGRGRRGVISWRRDIINQHGKVVQGGLTVTMVEGRGPRGAKPAAGDAKTDQPQPDQPDARRPDAVGRLTRPPPTTTAPD